MIRGIKRENLFDTWLSELNTFIPDTSSPDTRDITTPVRDLAFIALTSISLAFRNTSTPLQTSNLRPRTRKRLHPEISLRNTTTITPVITPLQVLELKGSKQRKIKQKKLKVT